MYETDATFLSGVLPGNTWVNNHEETVKLDQNVGHFFRTADSNSSNDSVSQKPMEVVRIFQIEKRTKS